MAVDIIIQTKRTLTENDFNVAIERLSDFVWAQVWAQIRSFIRKNWQKLLPFVIRRVMFKKGFVHLQFTDGSGFAIPPNEIPKKINEEIKKLQTKVFSMVEEKVINGFPLDEENVNALAKEILDEIDFPVILVGLYIMNVLLDRGAIERGFVTKIEDSDDAKLRPFIVARVFAENPRKIEKALREKRMVLEHSARIAFVDAKSPLEVLGITKMHLKFREDDTIIIKRNPKMVEEKEHEVLLVFVGGETYKFDTNLISVVTKELGPPEEIFVVCGKMPEALLMLKYKVGFFVFAPLAYREGD